MASHSIDLIAPTSRAWTGMKRVLFQPFDMGKWFVLGFTAWLASLLEGGGSSGGGGQSEYSSASNEAEAGNGFEQAADWFQTHQELAIGLGLIFFIVVVAIVVTLVWVRSRGKLMFLDNVVHNRAQVKNPWHQFKELGNSLFRWNLVFSCCAFLIILLLTGGIAASVYTQVKAGEWSVMLTIAALIIGLIEVAVILVIGYVLLLLEDFVIPLMWQHSLKTNDAWRMFGEVHRAHVGNFVLYVLWRWLLVFASTVGILILGIATCCIGFIPLMIPYIGAVLLLPVSVFFRFLGPEFLRHFGSDFDLLAE
jgi:hypothetical protein